LISADDDASNNKMSNKDLNESKVTPLAIQTPGSDAQHSNQNDSVGNKSQ